jgi:hypothetical protein
VYIQYNNNWNDSSHEAEKGYSKLFKKFGLKAYYIVEEEFKQIFIFRENWMFKLTKP